MIGVLFTFFASARQAPLREQARAESLPGALAVEEVPPTSGSPLPLGYETPPEPSLGRRAMAGSAWTVASYLGHNLVRLGTNLILVRLLAPDVFGLVAWLSTVLTGLQMFSDVGIGPAIIQNKRGEEDQFLRTAYTIQALRGFAIFAVACALAWPLARFYGIASFSYLIPVVALTAVIEGFRSTAFFRINRRLRMRELTMLELSRTVLQSILTVVIALQWPTVWSLLIPMLLGAVYEAVVTHLLLRDRRDRFGWNRECARLLFGFGKWVFISTLLTFFANSSDKLVFAKIFTLEDLGIYYIALVLATLPTQAILKVGQKVVFPAYSQVAQSLHRAQERHALEAIAAEPLETPAEAIWAHPAAETRDAAWEAGAARFRAVFAQVRMALLVLGGLAVAGLVATGPALVDVLYPPRYIAAGWMLQLLAAGAWFQVLEVTNGSAMLALGQPKWVALSMAAKVLALAVLIPILAWEWGFGGAVAAVALAEVMRYAGSVVGVSRLGVGLKVWGGDLLLTAAVAASAGLGWGAGLLVEDEVARLLISGGVTTALWVPLLWLMYGRWRRGMAAA